MLRNNDSMPNSSRAALTLAEVLVSMGIMTIGLLGVASLFPVGGHYMQQGEVIDTADAIAQAALDDAIIRGHLDPENWVILDIDRLKYAAGVTPVAPNKPAAVAVVNLNRLAPALRDALHYANNTTNGRAMTGSLGSLYHDGFYGAAYIIDPLGMAAGLNSSSTTSSPYSSLKPSESRRRFPATVSSSDSGDYYNLKTNSPSWRPWDLSTVQSTYKTWPVRRVSTMYDSSHWNSSSYRIMGPAAQSLFTADDDLALTLPGDSDSPARQRLETWQNRNNSNAVQSAARQIGGNYSWIISVSPGSSEARDALATEPDSYPYDVSVVVFYKRVLGDDTAGAIEAERLVNAKVVTTGTAGGELLLSRRPVESRITDYDAISSPFEELREGQYVMLTGPHPLSTARRPMLFNQWYKVQSIEDSGSPNIKGSPQSLDRENQVLVSLRGPDWPWQAASDVTDNTLLANDLRVTIVPGAVAVHTKTMRLESGSSWGN